MAAWERHCSSAAKPVRLDSNPFGSRATRVVASEDVIAAGGREATRPAAEPQPPSVTRFSYSSERHHCPGARGRNPQRTWATPLQTLLIAERAALLSGRDDDFTLIVTIGYTGMRWGEAIGLEREYLKHSLVNVEWQLREVNGQFHRIPPKDDSYPSINWEPRLPVDLPPFLATLLDGQAAKHPQHRCACRSQHGGSGQYIFTGPDGGHYRRSNHARRIFRPPATAGTSQ